MRALLFGLGLGVVLGWSAGLLFGEWVLRDTHAWFRTLPVYGPCDTWKPGPARLRGNFLDVPDCPGRR